MVTICGSDYAVKPDERDNEIALSSAIAFNDLTGPRVGDFVRMKDGELRRFTYDWGDGIQTTCPKFGGSFYLHDFGHASYSGSLDPSIKKEHLEDTGDFKSGDFWFFHHGFPCASSAVYVSIPCKVWQIM